ncbi:MAG: hypothetical protein ACYS8Z_13525, partial [Planctomycetota bacterium]
MSAKTKKLKSLLGGISLVALVVSVAYLSLPGLSVQNQPDGVSTLSRQDMKAMVGGTPTQTCKECDDCHTVSR